MSSQLIDKFKQLDAYAKTLEDFRIKTTTGAAITVTGGLIMVLLFLSELYTYMSPNISEELFVDTSRGHKLRINLDIIVPTISCNYLVLDAMDSSGEQHLQMEQNIHKRRLDLNGNPIEEPKKEEIAVSTTVKQNTSEVAIITCGSCYGAALNESQCCNTCDEVKEAYRLRRWALPDLSTVEQCKNDESIEKTNLALKEGCQIYGYMEVNRVGGSFHIAPGKSFTINHIHVHDVQPYSSSVFNTTHFIKHLSFGTDIEGTNTAPLDGINGVAKEGLCSAVGQSSLCPWNKIILYQPKICHFQGFASDGVELAACFGAHQRWSIVCDTDLNPYPVADPLSAVMFQYYLKIVPTMYVKLDRTVLHTNQFSVTRHQKSVSNVNAESGMPGAFFSYELSPLMVKYTEKERSIGHFATNICAIIGGVFTVAGILDALLYHSLNAFQNKIVLGKAG